VWSTQKEVDDAASQIDQAGEEVDDELEDLGGKFCGELGRAFDEGEGSGEEGPDELDERGDEVGQGGDDGRHCVCLRVVELRLKRVDGGGVEVEKSRRWWSWGPFVCAVVVVWQARLPSLYHFLACAQQ
jgi:hypothetical protein